MRGAGEGLGVGMWGGVEKVGWDGVERSGVGVEWGGLCIPFAGATPVAVACGQNKDLVSAKSDAA